MLPPGAEDEAPSEKIAVESWAAVHPDREEVRMVVGVLRDGGSACALRLRSHDEDHEVITGPDLVPGLIAGLGDTSPTDAAQPTRSGRMTTSSSPAPSTTIVVAAASSAGSMR